MPFLLHFIIFAFCVTCAKTHIYVFCICHLYLVAQSCPTLCDPMDCSPPGSSVHGNSPGENNWSGLPCPTLRNLPNPGIEPRSPILQLDTLPAEPQGKPKNTGVGSLSLLQQIFPTQELNRGLLQKNWRKECRVTWRP